MVEDKIFHGAIPGESEIGHVRLDKSGRIVEESCSGWTLDRKIRASIQSNPGSLLAQMVGRETGGEARFLKKAIEKGDSAARELLEETVEEMSFALSHVTHLMHPEVIVLGGGLSLVGEPLRAAVQKHLKRFIMHAFSPGPEVRLAALGEDAVPVGALVLAKS